MADNPFIVEVERRFEVSAERLFDAWLDPAKVPLWFAPGLGPMKKVEIDARVGGTFRFLQSRKEGDADHFGEYLVVDRPKKLVFTWKTGFDDGVSTVTVEFAADGGGTRVTLTHEMDPKWKEYAGRTEKGWTTMLEGIAAAA